MKAATPRFNLFEFLFIKPTLAIILTGLLVCVGFLGYRNMIKESLPDIEIPKATIVTVWPGATPLLVEKEITQKLEKELKGLKGLKKIYSASKDDTSVIAVSFKAQMPVAEAMQLLSRKVAAVAPDLPRDAEQPDIQETSVNQIPIITFALSGDVDMGVLESHARQMQDRMEKIPGISRVSLIGERKPIIHVRLRPERLRAMGISPVLVRQKIRDHNFDAPWGKFDNSDFKFTMKLSGAFRDLATLKKLAITRLPEGNVIRLKDIAEVTESFMQGTSRAAFSWEGGPFVRGVSLDLVKAAGKDTNALVAKARAVAEELQQAGDWDPKVRVHNLGDQSEVIKDELKRGFNNGWQAMLAVFLVLAVMLTWREAMVAALLVPITLLAAMGALWAMGYTFNLLVIVGMILALGLLVDDFILVMEGMHENIFLLGHDFRTAVKKTIKTYALPSFSGSVTTVLVLVPIAFVGGVDGKFIRLIPVTAAICLVLSYLVSIFLGPSLSRALFRGTGGQPGPGRMDRISQWAGARLMTWLKTHVVASRSRALAWVLGAVILFLLSLAAFNMMRNTLYPKEDGRGLGVSIELAPGTELEESEAVAQRIGEILRQKPYLQYVFQVVGEKDAYSVTSFHDGIGGSQSPNIIGFSCFFIPKHQGRDYAWTYVAGIRSELEQALAGLPGARLFLSPQLGGASGEDPVQIDIQGGDMDRLMEISQQIRHELSKTPGVVDVRDNIGAPRMELRFKPLAEALDFHGVEYTDLALQMSALCRNEKIGRFLKPGTQDDLDIRLGSFWHSRDGKMGGPGSWQELERISIINAQGRPVPLWSLVEPVMEEARQVITHKAGFRSVTVLSKLSTAYVPEVIAHMRPILEKMKQTWPPGYTYEFAGEKETRQTYEKVFNAFILAMVLVYSILALLFDSLVQPAIILFTVICGLAGVFGGFFLFGIPFSFSAAIGMVALVGIVVNDAIIMVETMNNHIREGKGVKEAALLGASDRLRPVVSTTVTNFAGLMPLALSDPGWSALCLAIIFGEATATLGTLVCMPAIFMLVTRPKGPELPAPAPA